MAVEIFMLPMEGDGTAASPYRPMYTTHAAVTLSGSLRSDKRDEAVTLIQAAQTYLDGVAAQAGVLRIATQANVDNALNQAQVDFAREYLEARHIPGDFIVVGETRRTGIRGLAGMFMFCQRAEGLYGVGFKRAAVQAGVNLETPFSDFPGSLKDMFIGVRDDHGWDNLGLTTASTLREILVAAANQFELTPIFIAGFEV